MNVTFQDWVGKRTVAHFGKKDDTPTLAFQNWYHFKEAFAPQFVARALKNSDISVQRCLDPFGGSGTTALACQFLGVEPTVVEVNPFLADLIEAKLISYDADALARDFGAVMRRVSHKRDHTHAILECLPTTFIQPGIKGRWIFDIDIAARIAAFLLAIDELNNKAHRKLFRVLLGSTLLGISNVKISGKGRRYRRGWQRRRRDPFEVDESLCRVVQVAIADIHRYARRRCSHYELLRGDSRTRLWEPASYEMAVFSPPYPNSFDYTDIYNIELWTLGYLTNAQSNRALRTSTMCSHVQIGRHFPPPPEGSPKLAKTLKLLEHRRDELWDHRIPEMVSTYFTDMLAVLDGVYDSLARKGSAWIVVGDSSYNGIQVNVADIIAELAPRFGWRVRTLESFRYLRTSAQQGGRPELAETLLVLKKD